MRRLLGPLCAMWLVLVALGFFAVARYASQAGAAADPPQAWPSGVALARGPGRATLLVTLHPECACSRATVAELARALAGRDGRADVYVLFVLPPGLARDPRRSSLWETVQAIPGARPVLDEGGALAARFGALTSGQVLLYDRDGALRFAGGITASRGHEGDSVGRDAVEALLDDARAPARAAVFGCSLFGERTP